MYVEVVLYLIYDRNSHSFSPGTKVITDVARKKLQDRVFLQDNEKRNSTR